MLSDEKNMKLYENESESRIQGGRYYDANGFYVALWK